MVKAKQEDLEDFDGPLDLILHLLSKNKIEIRDIQISLLLDQYLEWMERRERLNLEVASEFVTMAAQLVYIKTRMLLSIEDEEAMSEMEQLMAALEAHQRHESYLKIKGRRPAPGHPVRIWPGLSGKAPGAPERGAALRILPRGGRPADGAARRAGAGGETSCPLRWRRLKASWDGNPILWRTRPDPFWDGLLRFGVTRFRALFRSSRSRSEVVATFLAILELSKANRIHLAGTAEGLHHYQHRTGRGRRAGSDGGELLTGPLSFPCRQSREGSAWRGGAPLELKQLQAAIEGILFAAGDPVPVERICLALEQDRDTVNSVCQNLADEYRYDRRGIRLVRLENSWQMCSAPEYAGRESGRRWRAGNRPSCPSPPWRCWPLWPISSR